MRLMQFDANTFESLTGLELANYAVRLMQEGIAECDFLPYFQQNAKKMDLPHLELAVGILGKIGSDAAYRKVAEYLEHPDFNVRFVATKTIAYMKVADDVVMRCVVESLRRHGGDTAALAHELHAVLDRPANDRAQQIVSAYRSKLSHSPG